jgi:hypothetical protein
MDRFHPNRFMKPEKAEADPGAYSTSSNSPALHVLSKKGCSGL